MRRSDTIVVAGALAQRPERGGHAWVFLQYLLGFRRLGWDVLFLDSLAPEMCPGTGLERSPNAAYLHAVMERFGLGASYALLDRTSGRTVAGLPRSEVVSRVQGSAFLLNVMGYLDDEEILASAPLRVFLDIDPGFGQMWRELGLHDPFAGHDTFVTIGENIGRAGCSVPTCGLEWVTTPQPIVLEHWPQQNGGGGRFTSVGSWRGGYDAIEYEGTTYGLRAHEFRKFVSLPRLTGRAFEVALDIHEAEVGDLALLRDNGWRLVEPRVAAGDPARYQEYISGSAAELMVAKNMYVQTRGGWFSDRSICYLASGKPVVAQDTAFPYPRGEGLLAFATLEEAAAAVEEVIGDYARHERAARALAEEYFDSDRVLTRLVEGVS